MIINQKVRIYRCRFPHADTLNPKLHKIILKEAVNKDMGALMTHWNAQHIKEFNLIQDFAINLILGSDSNIMIEEKWVGRNMGPNLELRKGNLWGQLYNKGDYQVGHDHIPYHISYVYYVNTPKGSSPLVFDQSKKKLFPKAGEIVLFPSWVWHSVPPNNCDERTMIGGNLCYAYTKNSNV